MTDRKKEARKFGQEILDLCAGRDAEVVLNALNHAFGTAVGGFCQGQGLSLQEALLNHRCLTEAGAEDLARNYGTIREMTKQ